MKLAQAERILVIFTLAAGTALTQTFLDGASATFPCMHEPTDSPQWFDNTDNIAIFSRDGLGNPVKTVPAQNSPKYDHYEVDNSQNLQFDLKIDPVGLTDIGNLTCRDAVLISPIERYAVDIEVPTKMISLTCDRCDEADPPTCPCECSASGGYPQSLALNLTINDQPVNSQTTATPNADRTFNFTSDLSVVVSNNNAVLKCSVEGYVNQEDVNKMYGDQVVAERKLSSPNCTVDVAPTDTSAEVQLSCSCSGYPVATEFQYYVENGTEKISVDSRYSIPSCDVDTYFLCSGSNGIGFEDSTSPAVKYRCEDSTTAIPTTSIEPSTTVTTPIVTITNPTSTNNATTPTPMKTEKTKPTEGDGSNAVAIACGVVGGCIGVALVVILVIFILKKREGKGGNNLAVSGGNSNPSYTEPGYGVIEKDTQPKSTVKASTVDSTNSAPPVYGVVNKSTKKKSDNTDGNGVNAKLAEEQPEYAAVNKPKSQPQAAPRPRSSQPPDNKEQMELQYADLDHGNRGPSKEIRKPADEPTEYATVQSVIV